MKLMSNVCKKISESLKEDKSYICDYVSTPFGIVPLVPPCLSTEKTCEYCEGRSHYCPCIGDIQPENPIAKIWLCANGSCDVYNKRSDHKPSQPTAKALRVVLWPLFCEINNIGDLHHDVSFEKLEQSQAKISNLFKFASSPRGIILLRGDPGTGKTYSAMAICELFTRTSTSAVFTTQKQMSHNWLDTFRQSSNYNNYIDKLSNVSLLVVDDFGTAEMPSGFLSFFMDLVNTRMQWSNRGTVITTNLDDKKFSLFCGEALSDRVRTGLVFEFQGKTKRKQTIL